MCDELLVGVRQERGDNEGFRRGIWTRETIFLAFLMACRFRLLFLQFTVLPNGCLGSIGGHGRHDEAAVVREATHPMVLDIVHLQIDYAPGPASCQVISEGIYWGREKC